MSGTLGLSRSSANVILVTSNVLEVKGIARHFCP